MKPATMPCQHGVPRIREQKMWGTLYHPNTRDCAECAHEGAFQEVDEDNYAEAFFARVAARGAMRPIWEQELEHDGRGSVWLNGSPGALRHEPPTGHAMTQDEVFAWGAAIAVLPQALALLRDLARVTCEYVATPEQSCATEGFAPADSCPSCRSRDVLKAAGVEP